MNINININMNMNMKKKDTYNKPPASPPGLFEQDSNLRDIQCSYRNVSVNILGESIEYRQ